MMRKEIFKNKKIIIKVNNKYVKKEEKGNYIYFLKLLKDSEKHI